MKNFIGAFLGSLVGLVVGFVIMAAVIMFVLSKYEEDHTSPKDITEDLKDKIHVLK